MPHAHAGPSPSRGDRPADTERDPTASPPPQGDILAAAHTATLEPVAYARKLLDGRPIPPINSQEWLDAPVAVQRASLLIAGLAWVLADQLAAERLDAWVDPLQDDSPGGRYHRAHYLTTRSRLDRLRYPPNGDRDEWVQHGAAATPKLPTSPALTLSSSAALADLPRSA